MSRDMGPISAPHLLVIDDGMNEYLMLRKALLQFGPRGTWIELADTAEEGIALANSMEQDAVLLGYQLGDKNALWVIERLIQAAERMEKTMPAVFLFITPDSESDVATGLLQKYPWVTVIEKPYHPESVADVVYTKIRPKFSRHLKYYNLKLLDLMQAYMMRGQTITLRVVPPQGAMGVIFLRDGELVHAQMGSVSGIDALGHIARIQEGRIRIDVGCATAMRTIKMSPKEALRAAMQEMTAYSDRSFLSDTRRSRAAARRPAHDTDAAEQSTQARGKNLRRIEDPEFDNMAVFALDRDAAKKKSPERYGSQALGETDEELPPAYQRASVDPLDYLEDTTRGGFNAKAGLGGLQADATIAFDNMADDTLLFEPGEDDTLVLDNDFEETIVIPDGSEETMIVEIDEEGTIDLSEQKPKPPRG